MELWQVASELTSILDSGLSRPSAFCVAQSRTGGGAQLRNRVGQGCEVPVLYSTRELGQEQAGLVHLASS